MIIVSNDDDDDDNEAMKFVNMCNGISSMQWYAILRHLCTYHFRFNVIITFNITRVYQSIATVNISPL